MKTLTLLCLLLLPSACAEEVSHDEKLATARAVEFAETTFVRRNLERGYDLQADKVRSYVPLDKFMDKVKLVHRDGFPSKVTAAGAVPVKGEKLIHVRLRGEGGGERYQYGVTLTGTAATDYRVTNFSGGRTS